jgi:hypothetical protein
MEAKEQKVYHGWNLAQVVKYLPSKHKVLSSNYSTSKKKKRKLPDMTPRLAQPNRTL